MPTKIEFQTYSGGSGYGDRQELIGFCIEEPIDVLRYVSKNYRVFEYRGHFNPLDHKRRSLNSPKYQMSDGLVITRGTPRIRGCKIEVIASIRDLPIGAAYEETPRNRAYMDEVLNWLDTNYGQYNKYGGFEAIYNDILTVINDVDFET